ncbi:hypothetical protein Tco_1052927, partial [Tanacetum coccineum]
HNLRQQRGQSVQEYTTEFRRLAVMLGISTTYEDIFTKSRRRKMLESTSRTFSKKWVKNDRGRHAVATTISSDVVELVQVEEVDKSLTLMVKPTPGVAKEKEELFTLKIQVKQELIEAIVDTGSEKNLISSSLVERLGLETTPHPRPYSLGWIKKDVDTQVNRQCKFRFAITNQFIDEVTCEVVPLDICQVIFGSPYLWERDAVYFRRAQKYELEKDGKKYIVNKSNITKDDDLVKAFQARRMSSWNKERSRAKSVKEGNKHYTECNKDGHIREGCFKLIGYPEWWPGNSEGTKSVANMAHKEDEEGEWIFDSGCTKYITYLSDMLVNKKATHFEAPVVIPNGDSILVKGKWDYILPGGQK